MMLPFPLFLQHVADTVPLHPDSSHFVQSLCSQRMQIFEPQQMPVPSGGGLGGEAEQSQSGGGSGWPLDPPLDPPLDDPPPSAYWMSGTDEQAATSNVASTVIAPARVQTVTPTRLTQNVPVSPNIAPPRTMRGPTWMRLVALPCVGCCEGALGAGSLFLMKTV